MYKFNTNIARIFLISIAYILSFSQLKADFPADLPIPVIDIKNSPSPEAIFLSPFGPSAQGSGPYKNYLMILDSNINIISYKLVPNQENGYIGYHFKEEPNGMLSFLTRKLDGTINLADTSYNILRTLKDTSTEFNRIKYYAHYDLLPNGNTLLVDYNFQYVDLSKYFPQGEPNGAILQALVQELDKDNFVVFQWRSIDYFPVNKTQDALAPNIDYFHPNSMVLDNDGNLLLSARDLNSIIKINRNTGDVIWNLGGKDNEFTFIGENETNTPNYFSYQHDIRRLPNGNITIFDNGRQHNPQYSRAVEYKLDEMSKTCTLVWDYRHNPDFFADQHGSTQRMPNGNTLIAWGTYSMNGGTAVTEVKPDNSTALEFHFPTGLESQFIYKYPWPVCPLIASVEKSELLELNTYNFNTENQVTGVEMTFNKLQAFVYNRFNVDKYDCSPMNPLFSGRPPIIYPYRFLFSGYDFSSLSAEMHISLDAYPLVINKDKAVVYYRPSEGYGTFIPLQTSYNASENSLVTVTDTTGEFIIGYDDVPVITKSPFMFEPKNGSNPNIEKPVKFSWNPKGYFTNSQIQIATDTLFNNVIIDSTLRYISLKTTSLELNKKYFWRVRSMNEAGKSEWSNAWSFNTSEPYIAMIIPNGGEVWDTTSHIIRWDFNLKDSVDQFFKIELLRNGESVSVLQPSRFSAVNAYKWKIPGNTPEDSTYQIRVTSAKDANLTSMSSGFFKIVNKPDGVEDQFEFKDKIICSNYPNPFDKSTIFDFTIEDYGLTTITLFDVYGNEISKIYSQFLTPGQYQYNWDASKIIAGVYFYKISLGDYWKMNKMIIIK